MKWPSREVRDYFLGHADAFMQEAAIHCRRNRKNWQRFMKPREIFYKGRHLVCIQAKSITLGTDAVSQKLFAMCCEGIPKK